MMVLTHLSMFHRESAKTQTILASNVHCQLSHGYPIGYGPIESCKKKVYRSQTDHRGFSRNAIVAGAREPCLCQRSGTSIWTQ